MGANSIRQPAIYRPSLHYMHLSILLPRELYHCTLWPLCCGRSPHTPILIGVLHYSSFLLGPSPLSPIPHLPRCSCSIVGVSNAISDCQCLCDLPLCDRINDKTQSIGLVMQSLLAAFSEAHAVIAAASHYCCHWHAEFYSLPRVLQCLH
jgi:hypothetical protein